MMEILAVIFNVVSIVIVGTVFVGGLKGAIFHGGPGSFELAGMLWRGEIKRRVR